MKRTVYCTWQKASMLTKRHRKLGYTSIEVDQLTLEEYREIAPTIRSWYGTCADLLPRTGKAANDVLDDGVFRVTLIKEKEYPKMTLEIVKISIVRSLGHPDVVFVHTNLPSSYPGEDHPKMMFDVKRHGGEKYVAEFFPNLPVELIEDNDFHKRLNDDIQS